MAFDFSAWSFHPVVRLPDEYLVLDLTRPSRRDPEREPPFTIGRYDEDRRGMYEHELFAGSRTVHVGIDIGAPVGTPVHAFYDGAVLAAGVNPEPGDYGHVLVTEHRLGARMLYALHGHLSSRSVQGKVPGVAVRQGEVIGWIGAEHDNGGWPPHLHFQLSWLRPAGHDMPGVVAPEDRAEALLTYPDPRLVLGPLY